MVGANVPSLVADKELVKMQNKHIAEELIAAQTMDPYRVSRIHKLIKDKFPMKQNHDPGDILRYLYSQLQEEINQHQKTRPQLNSDGEEILEEALNADGPIEQQQIPDDLQKEGGDADEARKDKKKKKKKDKAEAAEYGEEEEPPKKDKKKKDKKSKRTDENGEEIEETRS